jgi:hypothetical protein
VIQGKPGSPIKVGYELVGAPQLGQPLQIAITVSAGALLVDGAVSLHAGDGLVVSGVASEIRIPTLAAGDAYRTSIFVTPLVLDELLLTIAAEGEIGGVRQAGIALVPIRLAPAKARDSVALKLDPIGGVVHSLPGIQNPSARLR